MELTAKSQRVVLISASIGGCLERYLEGRDVNYVRGSGNVHSPFPVTWL